MVYRKMQPWAVPTSPRPHQSGGLKVLNNSVAFVHTGTVEHVFVYLLSNVYFLLRLHYSYLSLCIPAGYRALLDY